jgi:hypothetical protein
LSDDLWQRKSKEWERELAEIRRDTALHEGARHDYMPKGSEILELEQTAPLSFFPESGRSGETAENAAFELHVRSRKSFSCLG